MRIKKNEIDFILWLNLLNNFVTVLSPYKQQLHNPVQCVWDSFLIWVTIYKPYEPRHDKTNKLTVRPAKTQISLGIRPVWSKSSLCAQWVAKVPRFFHADREDSDQTGRMPRLIWVFAGRTLTLLVLSCRGSYEAVIYITTGRYNFVRSRRTHWCFSWFLVSSCQIPRSSLFPVYWQITVLQTH